MNRTSPINPTQWAVLVGVNSYGHPNQELQGCVSDITKMATYLSASRNPVKIMKFTYSGLIGTDPGPNEIDQAPTRQNVIAGLEKIKRDALAGDYVYLHFSCHGTQVRDKAIGTTHEGTGDLALVLYDPNEGPQIFHTWRLATLLKEMVDLLLHVTVVLDCCFSGSTVRSDNGNRSSVRFLDYDLRFNENCPSFDFDSAANFLGIDDDRDVRHICPLMIKSNRYTMICACGPHEIAEELRLNESTYTGALSHFILQTLKSLQGTRISARTLYNHLRLKFRIFMLKQTPMWFGKRDLIFLPATSGPDERQFVTVIRKKNSQPFYLDAGFTHGVCQGDKYELYTIEDELPRLRAEVQSVGPERSTLTCSDESEHDLLETRWKAKRTSIPAWKIIAKLDFDAGQDDALRNDEPFLRLVPRNASETHNLSVVINQEDRYQILDNGGEPLPLVPTIPRLNPEAWREVLAILEHISKFKYFEGLENQDCPPVFAESFTVYLKQTGTEEQVFSGGLLEVEEEQEVEMVIENHGTGPLYISMFDMGPLWQNEEIFEETGQDFHVIPPKQAKTPSQEEHTGEGRMALLTSIPGVLRQQRVSSCDDLLKIFITASATSFSALALPKLEDPTEGKGENDQGPDKTEGVVNLLTNLSSTGEDTTRHWTTETFLLRTTSKRTT